MPERQDTRTVDRLERLKGQFGEAAERETARLLVSAKRAQIRNPLALIRLHETALFLRAYPQSRRVLKLADQLLFKFGPRLSGVPRDEFEYAEVSGIVRTSISTSFSHPFALRLAKRHGSAIKIDWERYEHPERLGRTLAKLIPEAFEDWAIEPHADWRRWLEQASGEKKGGGLRWLLERVDPEIYDLLEIPLRWEIGDAEGSRTRLRIPRRKIFFHSGPLLARRDVSIEAEVSKPKIAVDKLSRSRAEAMMNVIAVASATRYRELYGFEYPDLGHVFHADLGRGVDFYFCGPEHKWRLPKRHYTGGVYFKNGVPVGYVEIMWNKQSMEVGFNLYYTFRRGETAWLYARLLKLFHERFGAFRFAIDPYQIGHDNPEAIESGAFWFYYKLGFVPLARDAADLAANELQKVESQPDYRTSPRLLRRLAESWMVYSIKKEDVRRPVRLG